MCAKIALVTPPTISHRTAEETLALGYLAEVLRKANHDVCIVDSWVEGLDVDAAVERILKWGCPDLIGMSCYRSNLDQASSLLQALGNKTGVHIPAFCGGYGPTFHPDDFLDGGFDVAVIGEGEDVVVPLVAAMTDGGSMLRHVPCIAYREHGDVVKTPRSDPIMNVDLISSPARDTIESVLSQKNFVNVCTSRGCMAACTFCSIFAFALIGNRDIRWRGRSISNIIDEIAVLYERYGVKHFKFVDDSFIEPPRSESWAEQFANELERRRLLIRFRTQVRADRLTPTLVESLRSAGWFATSVGVENASPSALQRMGKEATYADNVRAIEWLEQNGVYVQMGMILFDPHTTMKELHENLSFLQKTTWPVNKGIFTEMYAAEGTAFTKTLRKRGTLQDGVGNQNYTYVVQDTQAARVYALLKKWHRSHARVYDWVIDSLTAPKVLPDSGYQAVHALCQALQRLDVQCLKRVLVHVEECPSSDDKGFMDAEIQKSASAFLQIEASINRLYQLYGLRYDAVPNPFLGTTEEEHT